MSRISPRSRFASFVTEYEDQSETDELVIPEDLSAASVEEIQELAQRAEEAFDALYGDGEGALSDEDLATLAQLTETIETLTAEIEQREQAAVERRAKADELATRLRSNSEEPEDEDAENADESEEGEGEGEEPEAEAEAEDENSAETIVAAGAPKRISLKTVNSRRRNIAPETPQTEEAGVSSVLFAASDVSGVTAGQGIDWLAAGKMLDRKLASHNSAQFKNANARGMHVKEQHALAVVKRNFAPELIIDVNDPDKIESAVKFATDESRLPGGSLVAAGGWCAPSEVTYDLLEMESRDGLLSIPEVNVARGGIKFPISPAFSDLYSEITGFSYTEEEDIAGDYDGDGGGSKPCYVIDCPDFDEVRLDIDGLCIQAGLLQRRGFPEYQARIMRGALVAHDHRLNASMISRMVAGSTEITMPTQQAGATAPLLTSIELQVEHYKYTHRLSRSTTLEAIFPFWVRGAVRADLARRQGVELLSVTDAQINAWFTLRGVNAQFVYNWQAIDTTAAASFVAYPNEVSFLLYTAGTWVRLASDIITLDTLYDSTLLGTNDFTALFTEEGWNVAKRGIDSRLVTVGIESNGATHAGVAIAHNGTTGPIEVSGLVTEATGE